MFEDKEEILNREKADPNEGDRPWPLAMWLFVLTMSCFAFGYLLVFSGDGKVGAGDFRANQLAPSNQASGTSQPIEIDPAVAFFEQGRKTYQSLCAACHQSNGAGIPGAFPPLDASSWVTGDASLPARIVLHGLSGPIEVKGQTYNGVMPAFGSQLSDQEIAAVISYIRGSWSNEASPVDEETVASLREASGNRPAWTADELLAP
ncbi:cytochrome c [Pelagicoccus sp. SDUM812003]|uniref:c-type cytochrome n=1 Tax=Pelagicoccus sp. SDUM812003 TaxID=3041267 RepID=UPI00280F91C0|nr:cytochrome c [Pelagicoccus sp. SDUM812003]MDQ8203052.1 cytochrome c [Pelagicoccus sp. SDUM812003]